MGTGTVVNDDTTTTTTSNGNGTGKPQKAAVVGEEDVSRTDSATTVQTVAAAGQSDAIPVSTDPGRSDVTPAATDFARSDAPPAATVSALFALAVDVQAVSFGSSPVATQTAAREQEFDSVYDLLLEPPATEQTFATASEQTTETASETESPFDYLLSLDL